MQHIKSPLNYTGNKYRILDQMQKYFPKKITTMVDLFCGGATVGLNTECDKVIFVDIDKYVIGLLEFLSNSDFDNLLKNLEALIKKYGLSYSAKHGYSYYKSKCTGENLNNGLKSYNEKKYYKLRDDYNNLADKTTDDAYTMLYLLIAYSFNNDIRFSKSGLFNLPAGKTDLNKSNLTKLKEYIERVKNIECEFICADFSNNEIRSIIEKADFIYMDPPYLITNAVYNESNKWTEANEKQLLELMDYFIENKKHFVLSNVIEKHEKRNEHLYKWTCENEAEIDVIDIDYNYSSSSYNKKNRSAKEREVIVLPKREL